MSSLNKVQLIGNLGQDPEVRYTPGGSAVCNFTIATNEAWTTKEGTREERTEWHRVVVWGRTAELCGEYLGKGRQVYVEGRLQTRKWADKDGHERYTTEVVGHTVKFLGGRSEWKSPSGEDFGGSHGGEEGGFSGGPAPAPTEAGGGDDIPF